MVSIQKLDNTPIIRTSLTTVRDSRRTLTLKLVSSVCLIVLSLGCARFAYLPKLDKKLVDEIQNDVAHTYVMVKGDRPTYPAVVPSPVRRYEYIEVKVTHYCLCVKCCGKWSKEHPSRINDAAYQQRTYSGTIPKVGTAAVDTKFWRPDLTPREFFELPLEERTFTLEGDPTIYYMEDTGSAVRGAHVDLYVPSHQDARQRGKFMTTPVKEVL